VLTIGPVRARQIASVSRRTSLRAGDAAYVWAAERERLPLVTWDAEIASRTPSGWPGGSAVASPPGGWSA
jgi:predicted nucleic acid-binding protein